jgi:hypothetical protein
MPFPLVTGYAAKEQTSGAAHRCVTVAEGIPRKTNTRGDMVVAGGNDAAGKSSAVIRIAGKEQTIGSAADKGGLRPGNKRCYPVLWVRRCGLHVPTLAEIQGQGRFDPEVILGEESVKPHIVDCGYRCILIHGFWQA